MVDTNSNDDANLDDDYALSYNFPQLHRYTDKARQDFFHSEKKLNITHVISIAVVINLLYEMGFDQGVLDVRYTIKHKNCQKPEVSHPHSVELKIKLKVFRWLALALAGLALARLASRVIRLCKT